MDVSDAHRGLRRPTQGEKGRDGKRREERETRGRWGEEREGEEKALLWVVGLCVVGIGCCVVTFILNNILMYVTLLSVHHALQQGPRLAVAAAELEWHDHHYEDHSLRYVEGKRERERER